MDEDDMVCNAEVTMQEMVAETMESDEVVDFSRSERGVVNSKTPVLEADLSYIMQNAIIDTGKDVKGSESKLLVESSGSDESSSDDDDDDDDDVKIILVKDKNSKSNCPAEDVVIVSSSSDEDSDVLRKDKKDGKCNLVPERKPLDKIIEQSIGGKVESEENIVNNLLSDLVRKTVKLSREHKLTRDGRSSADSSESEAAVEDMRIIKERENQVIDNVPRVPNEVLPEELDIEVEEVFLTPKDHLNQIGVISGVVEKMVVVKSNNEAPALDCESAFFFEDRSYLGKVFDTFGPVKLPYYTINIVKNVDKSKLSVGTKICFVPFNEDLTKYVFLAQLKKLKGSDASWRNDCEPPENCIDYSDDEEERAAKREKKKKNSEMAPKVTDNQMSIAQRNKPFNKSNQNHSFDIQNTHQQNHKKGYNKFWQNKASIPNSSNSEARKTFTQSAAPSFNNQSDTFHKNSNNHSFTAPVVNSSLQPPVRPHTNPPAWPGVPPQPPNHSSVNVQVLTGTQPPIHPGIQPNMNNTPAAIGNRLSTPNMDLHTLLRPLLRPQTAPVQQGGFPSIRIPSQNVLPGNGSIQARFPPQPMLGNDSLPRQQVFNQLNNLINVRIPVPQQIPSQNGGQFYQNRPANNMSQNSMLPPSNVGQNYNQPLLQQSFGNGYSDQTYPNNKVQTLDNIPPANSHNLLGNSRVFHDKPNFGSQERTSSSNNSQSGIVKLNGFTFKI